MAIYRDCGWILRVNFSKVLANFTSSKISFQISFLAVDGDSKLHAMFENSYVKLLFDKSHGLKVNRFYNMTFYFILSLIELEKKRGVSTQSGEIFWWQLIQNWLGKQTETDFVPEDFYDFML